MSRLPVSLIIRLCTDDDSVVNFYNDLDNEEEFALDVIDDWESEAKEIRQAGNNWFTYSQALHLVREAGINIRLFDLMDEQRFRAMQISEIALYVINPTSNDPALQNWENSQLFSTTAAGYVDAEARVWDIVERKSKKVIDVNMMRAALSRGYKDPYFWENMTTAQMAGLSIVLTVVILWIMLFFSM